MTLSAKPKNPIFGLGQAFNGGVIGDATIEFIGSGLVGTAYGLPGFSATLVGTGLYSLGIPKTAIRGLRLYPNVMGPEGKGPTGALIGPQGSGVLGAPPGFNAHVSHVGGQSGTAYLNTTSLVVNASGPAAAMGPTGLRPMFPPTGSVVNLLVLGSPIARY